MRRREFLTSLFGGAAAGGPFFASGGSSTMPLGSVQEREQGLAIRCERLLLQVQETNRRLAETERDLSQAQYNLHLINNALVPIRFMEDLVRDDGTLSDEDRRVLDISWRRIGGLTRAVFDRAKARRERDFRTAYPRGSYSGASRA